MSETQVSEKVGEMKAAFDRTFSLPVNADIPDVEDMLAIRIRGDGYALRVLEISGLMGEKKILPVPGSVPAFLGLTGMRGIVVPVWDLAALLGYDGVRRNLRWLIRGQGESPWALAFDEFEGYFRIPRLDLRSGVGDNQRQEYAVETCSIGGTLRPVLSLVKVLEAVKKKSKSS